MQLEIRSDLYVTMSSLFAIHSAEIGTVLGEYSVSNGTGAQKAEVERRGVSVVDISTITSLDLLARQTWCEILALRSASGETISEKTVRRQSAV